MNRYNELKLASLVFSSHLPLADGSGRAKRRKSSISFDRGRVVIFQTVVEIRPTEEAFSSKGIQDQRDGIASASLPAVALIDPE